MPDALCQPPHSSKHRPISSVQPGPRLTLTEIGRRLGEGWECSASRGIARFKVRVLISSLAAILLWPIGTAAERCGLHERLRPGSRKRRAYSGLFLAPLLLTLEGCRTTLAKLMDAIESPNQWVSSHHDALLAG